MSQVANGASAEVLAINVLIVPEAPMRDGARQLNERLRQSHPQSFALDESHVPHISLLHRFVAAKDLPQIYAAVERVLSRHPLRGEQLMTAGLESSQWGDAAIVSIEVEKTPALAALQAELIAALRPYPAPDADHKAFVTSPGPAGIDADTVEYVKTFERQRTGDNFKPHITAGLTDPATARELKTQPTQSRTFSIETVAVYQLGNIGTARKELWRAPR